MLRCPPDGRFLENTRIRSLWDLPFAIANPVGSGSVRLHRLFAGRPSRLPADGGQAVTSGEGGGKRRGPAGESLPVLQDGGAGDLLLELWSATTQRAHYGWGNAWPLSD